MRRAIRFEGCAIMLPVTKYARSDEVCIAYQVTGEGPDVIWAPGTMSHLDMDWENPRRAMFFEKFSKFCRLIRFDKRGTGLSDRPIKMALWRSAPTTFAPSWTRKALRVRICSAARKAVR
jgi:pimeloyl-ACP methyl ester carboxylesterase